MQPVHPWIVAIVLLTGACSGGDSTAPTTGAAIADPIDACAVLGPADFKTVGFTVESEGEDVSDNFNLSTTTSVACQWTNFDDNQGGSWELVIGAGGAESAYESDLSLAELDTVSKLAIGDDAYFVDKTSSLDATDHDFEAGVLVGDTYFTMSTTDDRGGEAIAALATLVADQLEKS